MVSLSLLLGLPVLALLGLVGARLRWSPRLLWRGVFVMGSMLTVVYLAYAAWKTLSVI